MDIMNIQKDDKIIRRIHEIIQLHEEANEILFDYNQTYTYHPIYDKAISLNAIRIYKRNKLTEYICTTYNMKLLNAIIYMNKMIAFYST